MIIIIIIILFYPIAFTLVELINSLLFVPCFVTDLCKDYLPTPPTPTPPSFPSLSPFPPSLPLPCPSLVSFRLPCLH